MTPAHRQMLLRTFVVTPLIANALLNAGWVLLTYRGMARVPLMGPQSIAFDTAATCFLLPLITCVLTTPIARAELCALRLPLPAGTPPGLRWLPRSTFWRGVVLGLICAVVVSPPTVGVLAALHVKEQTFWTFVVFKTAFAVLLGAVVTPLCAIWAIGQHPRATEPDFSRTRPPGSVFFVVHTYFLVLEGAVYFLSFSVPVLLVWSARASSLPAILACGLLGWAGAGVVFVAVLICFKRGIVGEIPAGRYFRFGKKAFRWALSDAIDHIMGRSPFVGMINDISWMRRLYYLGMGARIDPTVNFGRSVIITEPWLATLGKNVMVGTDAILATHKIEKDVLTLEPIVIGDDVVVGARAFIWAGVTVGDRAIVGAGSVVLPGTIIPAGETWVGNPARKYESRVERTRGGS